MGNYSGTVQKCILCALFLEAMTAPVSAVITAEIIVPGNIYPFSVSAFPYTAPAMDMAIEDLNKRYDGQLQFFITYLYDKNLRTCEDIASNIDYMMSNYYYSRKTDPNATVVIFPGCLEGLQVARLTNGWNIPMILGAATNPAFRNKKLFAHLIQGGPVNMSSYMGFFLKFLDMFRWQTIYIVLDKASAPFETIFSTALLDILRRKAETKKVTFYSLNSAYDTFSRVLADIRQLARVVFFFGHARALRQFLLDAKNANMTNGDYVFITTTPFDYPYPDYGNITWQNHDQFDDDAFSAFQSLFVVFPKKEAGTQLIEIFADMKTRSKFVYNLTYSTDEMPSSFATSIYGCIHVFGQILHQIVLEHTYPDLRNGARLAARIWNRTFHTPVGIFNFDTVGERQISRTIQQLDPQTGAFITVVEQDDVTFEVTLRPIKWLKGYAPPDVPECGFTGLLGPCAENGSNASNTVIIVVTVLCIITIGVSAFFTIRKFMFEIQLQNAFWDLRIAFFRFESDFREYNPENRQPTSTWIPADTVCIASYKDRSIYVKTIAVKNVFTRSRRFLRTINALKNLERPCIAEFIGILRVDQSVAFAFASCQRGNLRDFFRHSRNTVEWNIKLSFTSDLIQGIQFVHVSSLKYHGHISALTCHIDKHMGLKITELGIDKLLQDGFSVRSLDDPATSIVKNQASDIRALGALALGIAVENPVLDVTVLNKPGAIEDCLQAFPVPPAEEVNLSTDILKGIKKFAISCLLNDTGAPPSISRIISENTNLVKNRGNVVDDLLNRMQNYTFELEVAVHERSTELEDERRNCDNILLSILPGSVMQKLRRKEQVQPEKFDSASVSFSDIVGFLEFTGHASPFEVFSFLNRSHGLLDLVIASYDVYKLETIGDSYVTVSGLPLRNSERHAAELCFAQLETRKSFSTTFDTLNLGIRIGIHSGACVAAVVGISRPRYCLFGDTMNTASRMESHGQARKIHVSSATVDMIGPDLRLKLKFLSRGGIQVKGKGIMETYWLE